MEFNFFTFVSKVREFEARIYLPDLLVNRDHN